LFQFFLFLFGLFRSLGMRLKGVFKAGLEKT